MLSSPMAGHPGMEFSPSALKAGPFFCCFLTDSVSRWDILALCAPLMAELMAWVWTLILLLLFTSFGSAPASCGVKDSGSGIALSSSCGAPPSPFIIAESGAEMPFCCAELATADSSLTGCSTLMMPKSNGIDIEPIPVGEVPLACAAGSEAGAAAVAAASSALSGSLLAPPEAYPPLLEVPSAPSWASPLLSSADGGSRSGNS
mmetsp:Transcript_43026/g.76160  ORF Transcript_43026/g.76160 Transcript_43026/m.76160 type:complete len:204 (+) Transcript_43026:1026-1637(+)